MDSQFKSAMPARIAIVGSINMDLVFRAPRMPVLGETVKGGEFHQIPGGKGANQAVAAARLGAQVAMIACVGADGFGTASLRTLADDGIDITHVSSIAGTPTGVAGIFVNDDGHNSIVIAPGANDVLSTAHVDAAAATIGEAKLLICQLETPLQTVTHALTVARQRDVKVILNPAPAQALSDDLLAQVNYLVVNETEASQLSGIDITDQSKARLASQILLRRGPGAVLLTMGEHGVLVAEHGASTFIAAVAVEVVDTTAAGDTFVGALAVGLAQGLSLVDASTQAQYAAALTVTKLGAQTSIPMRDDVEQFMAERNTAAIGNHRNATL
jgi:ribokinase